MRRRAALIALCSGTLSWAILLGPGAAPARGPSQPAFMPPLPGPRAVVWAVGDGADGGADGLSVAEMIDSRRVDRFLYLGDVYENGTAVEFERHYRPLFGRFDPVGAPTMGNHEYPNRATGYEPYWGSARGRPPPNSYSFSIAGWQLLSLNSNEPLGAGSAQLVWLERRLERTPRFGNCRIAFTHHPRYSAGWHGDNPDLEPLWQTLAGRARLLLSGHDHDMQRFLPAAGITQLVSGAGGVPLRDSDETDPRTAFVADDTHGALRLRLRPGVARTSFVSVAGEVLDGTRIGCRRRG